MSISPEECAHELLEVAPLVVRSIHVKMRDNSTADLSVPQFRALGFVDRHTGASLSDVAEHLGLQLPSASRLVDGLVARKLMMRQEHAADRRCVTLSVSARGRSRLQIVYDSTQAHLAGHLAVLSEAERATVMDALRILHPLFTSGRETALTGKLRGNSRD